MEILINSLDLLRATKSHKFDMGSISEAQWLEFGEEFILAKEVNRMKEDLQYMIENSHMKVKFSEVNDESVESMVATIKLEYLHRSGKLTSLNYQFCSYGQLNNPFSDASEVWRDVVFKEKESKVEI